MQPEIIDLYLSDAATRKQWQGLLTDLGITNFAASETAHLDHTIGIYEGDKLVATGSTAGNVIKYVGACHKNSEAGAYFNAIISALLNDLAQRQIFHVFVFTKPKYVASFEYVGFHALAQTDSGAILETGDTGVQDYVAALPKIEHQDQAKVAGIVMNANPFTLGHRYLIETAAKENDLVYVFVVNTDASLFTTAERQQLVTAGTADLQRARGQRQRLHGQLRDLPGLLLTHAGSRDSVPNAAGRPTVQNADCPTVESNHPLPGQRTVLQNHGHL
jgi:cytidyltransferase-related domain